MGKSATELNRERTAARITRCAQTLAEERGLDGFTMEDLAACAGVSRRTLFNYVEGKLDAVLGAPAAPDPADLAVFRAGGPTGRLAEDVKATVIAVLDRKDPTSREYQRVRRLIAADPRLHKAMYDKFGRLAALLAEAIVEREGSRFGALGARAAATVTVSLFGVALEAFVADPDRSLAEHYAAVFDGTAAFFA